MTAFVMFGAISPLIVVSGIIVLLVFLLFGPLVLGAVLIRERQVGVVVKRFGTRALVHHQIRMALTTRRSDASSGFCDVPSSIAW